MKKVLIILMFIITTNANAYELERDKINHFGVSFGLGFIGNQILPDTISPFERIVYGTIIGTVPGLLKEILDKNNFDRTGFSGRDLFMDVLGSMAGSLVGEKIRIYVRTEPVHQVFIAYTGEF